MVTKILSGGSLDGACRQGDEVAQEEQEPGDHGDAHHEEAAMIWFQYTSLRVE